MPPCGSRSVHAVTTRPLGHLPSPTVPPLSPSSALAVTRSFPPVACPPSLSPLAPAFAASVALALAAGALPSRGLCQRPSSATATLPAARPAAALQSASVAAHVALAAGNDAAVAEPAPRAEAVGRGGPHHLRARHGGRQEGATRVRTPLVPRCPRSRQGTPPPAFVHLHAVVTTIALS